MKTEDYIHLLAAALPYVEDAAEDPLYTPEGQKKVSELAAQIRAAVESHPYGTLLESLSTAARA